MNISSENCPYPPVLECCWRHSNATVSLFFRKETNCQVDVNWGQTIIEIGETWEKLLLVLTRSGRWGRVRLLPFWIAPDPLLPLLHPPPPHPMLTPPLLSLPAAPIFAHGSSRRPTAGSANQPTNTFPPFVVCLFSPHSHCALAHLSWIILVADCWFWLFACASA